MEPSQNQLKQNQILTIDYRLVILELLLRPESSPEAALKLGRDGWNPTKKWVFISFELRKPVGHDGWLMIIEGHPSL